MQFTFWIPRQTARRAGRLKRAGMTIPLDSIIEMASGHLCRPRIESNVCFQKKIEKLDRVLHRFR
jgi:hypothetical protein